MTDGEVDVSPTGRIRQSNYTEIYALAVSVQVARQANEDRMIPYNEDSILWDVPAHTGIVPVEYVICREYDCGLLRKAPKVPEKYWSIHDAAPGEHPASSVATRKAYEIWAYEYRHTWLPVNGRFLAGFRLLKEPPPESYNVCFPTLYQFLTQ